MRKFLGYFKPKRRDMTMITSEDKFQLGDQVKWLGSKGTIEGKAAPSRWLVWTEGYLIEVYESELMKVESTDELSSS